MTKDGLRQLIQSAVLSDPLGSEQVDGLTEQLYCMFNAVDVVDKTVVIEIPIPGGKIPDDMLMKYCAYIDLLKGYGARNAVFLAKGASLATLSDRELEGFGLQRKG